MLEKITGRMNNVSDQIRIDLWLWAVRIFKTRSLAATSCRASKVRINDEIVKPSKAVREGDIVNVHKGKSKITVEVTAILEKRVSAKDALNYKREISIITEERVDPIVKPIRGEGRPTKRQRRVMDAFLDQIEKGSSM